jgi:predicted transcriptional regulator
MSILKALSGKTRFGWREKRVLLVMLKSDDPPGKPNLIWFDIYNEFNINYDNLKKKYQPKLYREEKNCRRSLYRLTKRGFVKPVIAVYDNFLLQDPRGIRYIRYSLTAKGRAIAHILKKKEKTANIN